VTCEPACGPLLRTRSPRRSEDRSRHLQLGFRSDPPVGSRKSGVGPASGVTGSAPWSSYRPSRFPSAQAPKGAAACGDTRTKASNTYLSWARTATVPQCDYSSSLVASSGVRNPSTGVEPTGLGAGGGTRMAPRVTPRWGAWGLVAARPPRRGGAPAAASPSPSAWATSSPRCSWPARSTHPAPSHLHPDVRCFSSSQLTVSPSDCSDQINLPIKFVPVGLGGELKYSREQMRWVEESIQIRRAAEPVELIEAV